MRSRFMLGKNIQIFVRCFLGSTCIPLVVDTYVLQTPIATSGETASTSQVLLKGPVVRACWCIIRVEP
jgi:hypothetical protein